MNTLYVEGNSLLHRLSARVKLIALTATGIALIFIASPVPLAIAAFMAALLYASLRIGWRQSWLRLRPVFLTIFVVAVFAFLVSSAPEAATMLFRLTTLMLLAAAVTATTTIGDFIDEITLAARPLERLGLVKAADIGLSLGLVIRFVPEVVSRYRAIREAHAARGLKARPVTLAVPLIILTLKSADEIAAAIDARGVRGQN
ncbi:energy-coupling factor transporter transmembrane protein EcfT [Rhizobium sp. LCM 4573]|uniref:energy-coupling factor transporter transmembrane component T family protein n=1 Tax=Rhizobium sp. LCM 4573 TaxID=1848291 RepID=UPI0008DA1BED|nr:energy-coupling factor transporter transmembrane protein EcfT [Rhizobium sp. LCM 4573]OHV75918.1 transporter [Rhizobium sp. LCM 4573]